MKNSRLVNFPEQLKELREEYGVTQTALAQGIGVSKGLISLWENGLREPPLPTPVALADSFDVPRAFLTGRTQACPRQNPPRAAIFRGPGRFFVKRYGEIIPRFFC